MYPRAFQSGLVPWVAGLLLAASAVAHAGGVAVSEPWARATVPGQKVGVAYMNITSAGSAELVKAESPAAGVVEIHTMRMQDGVMEMRMLEKLPLPAGETVRLEPGGLHLMLFDLKAPLASGQQIAIQLHVKSGGRTQLIDVAVPVRGRE